MENCICPKCQETNVVSQDTESAAASINGDTSVAPTATVTTVATATKPDIKAKVIACVIVLAILGGLYWGISHFLFSDSEEQKPTFAMNMTAAEITLGDYVTNPSTLKFSYSDEDWEFVTNDNKRIKMESSFECQNSFGVAEEHDFVLVITYADDYEDFTINQLYIDKEKYV